MSNITVLHDHLETNKSLDQFWWERKKSLSFYQSAAKKIPNERNN